VPSFDDRDDFIGIRDPAEWTRIRVGFGKAPLDRDLEFHDGAERTMLQPSLCQIGKIAFNDMEPG